MIDKSGGYLKTGPSPTLTGSGDQDETKKKKWFLILDSCKKLEFRPQKAPKSLIVLKSDYATNYGLLEYQKILKG